MDGPERDEDARPVPDRVAHHLGELARERPLDFLGALLREDVIFEHEIVGDRHRHDHQVRHVSRERGVEQARLRHLQLAAVAAAALRIEEQIVLLHDLGDVGLERDEVRGILRAAPDRNRARDVAMEQPEGPAEEIDAGRDERRPHARIVEHDRLDQVVDVALVIRRVHDAMVARGRDRVVRVLRELLDLPQDGVERVLQRPVEFVPLRRPELVEVSLDAFARPLLVFAVSAAQILDDFLTSENRLGEFVEHVTVRDYSIEPPRREPPCSR